jgi:hypothetical protein
MALEKWFDGILTLWTMLSLFYYYPPAYLKAHHPRFLRHLVRLVTCLWFVIAPIAAYELFVSFRSAKPASRFVIAFLAFVALIGLASRWWSSLNQRAPDQS